MSTFELDSIAAGFGHESSRVEDSRFGAGLVRHIRHVTYEECSGRTAADGLRVAVVSSSTSAEKVLEAAGIRDLFELVVDGMTARRLGLTREGLYKKLKRLGIE